MKLVIALFLLAYQPLVDDPVHIPKMGDDFTITFTGAELIHNHHVGNDWVYYVQIDQDKLYRGDHAQVTVALNQTITISCFLFETNEKHLDSATKTVEWDRADLLVSKNDELYVDVTIREGNGRYAGNTAQMRFFFTVH